MKSIIRKTMSLVAICAALFSFSPKPGGEGFEIYLNNKVMIQKFGGEINSVESLHLDKSLSAGQITIKYHHCGKVGKNRIITIKDGQNKILKEFRYTDAATPVAAMALNVKDILTLSKGNSQALNLYYSSNELTKQRLLTSLVIGTNTTMP
ncbi:MAG: hypothetical protein ABIU11_02435 [Chitinophagaceae bacterium]